MKKGDIVRITWLDPQTNAGWVQECSDLEPITSVGIFIQENETTLWLASSYHSGTEEFADELIWPKGCIISLQIIE